jgi:hypothetical protein
MAENPINEEISQITDFKIDSTGHTNVSAEVLEKLFKSARGTPAP